MKKIIIILTGALMLLSCGVGSYSVSSGKADEGMISFVSGEKTPITVTIDNVSHDVFTVKTKAWHKDRDIKKTTQNTIFPRSRTTQCRCNHEWERGMQQDGFHFFAGA